MSAVVVGYVNGGMVLPVALVFIFCQWRKHRAVVHPVPIDYRIEIAKALAALAVHKNGAHRAAGLVPTVAQIIFIVSVLQ